MRILRLLSITTFVAGAVLLAFGFIRTRGDADQEAPPPLVPFDLRASVTPSPTIVSSVSPTASPTPFDGAVARMIILALGVDHPIEEIGKDEARNQLETPKNATGAVGWYPPGISSRPGFGGNALFSAHVNYNLQPGPFLNLHKAKGGEEVIIQMEGGPEYRYRIVFGHRYVIDLQYDPAHDEANVIKMGELIEAANKPPGAEWITLITCSCEPGRLINIDANGLGECVDRDVVIAERIQ